jgi:uncharacterized membrane protein
MFLNIFILFLGCILLSISQVINKVKINQQNMLLWIIGNFCIIYGVFHLGRMMK